MLALTKTILAVCLGGCSVAGLATGGYFLGRGSPKQEEPQQVLRTNERVLTEEEIIWDWISIQKGEKKCQRVIKGDKEEDIEVDNICGQWSKKISVNEGDKDYLWGVKEEVRKKIDDWKKEGIFDCQEKVLENDRLEATCTKKVNNS